MPVSMALSIAAALLLGCTSTGEDPAPDTTSQVAVAVPEVTTPPERQTPFCQAMLDLDDALPDDPAIDTREQVLAAYEEALTLVPTEIEAEFRAVISALESGSRATLPGDDAGDPGDAAGGEDGTIAPPVTAEPEPADDPDASVDRPDPADLTDDQLFAEEGWLPDDDPAVRVNEYIEFACRDTINNPGPPATVPDAGPPTSEAG